MVNLFISFFFAFFPFVSLAVCLVMPHPDQCDLSLDII